MTDQTMEERLAIVEAVVTGLLAEIVELKGLANAFEEVLKKGQVGLDEWEAMKDLIVTTDSQITVTEAYTTPIAPKQVFFSK